MVLIEEERLAALERAFKEMESEFIQKTDHRAYACGMAAIIFGEMRKHVFCDSLSGVWYYNLSGAQRHEETVKAANGQEDMLKDIARAVNALRDVLKYMDCKEDKA